MNDDNEIIDRYSYNVDRLYQLQISDALTEKERKIISNEFRSLDPEINKLIETNIDAVKRMLVDPRPSVRLEGARRLRHKLPAEARATYLELRTLKNDIAISAGFGLDRMEGKEF